MSNRSEAVTVVVPAYNEARLIGDTLHALTHQNTDTPYHVVVVDNASTDSTAEIASSYGNVTVLHEPQKGTGYAVNTGFQHALQDSPYAILRTDADTIPAQNWVETTSQYLHARPEKQLISGLVRPRRDSYYHRADEILLPASYVGYRLGATVAKVTLWPLRIARGGNMAVRPEAFQAVGGFPDGSIEDTDETLELTKKIYDTYGLRGLGNVHSMEVRTSMRRIHTVGWLGLIKYYMDFSGKPTAEVRKELTGGVVDIR